MPSRSSQPPIPRAELVQKIRDGKARGLTMTQIAIELDVDVRRLYNANADPDGSKQKERRKLYQGACTDCGGPTDGGSGRDNAPSRCHWCAQGKPRPRIRLSVPFRLDEIPLDVRLEGARAASRIEPDPNERIEILLAALNPSDETRWLSESARPLLQSFGVAA